MIFVKALVLEDIGKLEYCDVDMPKPAKGEVLVKVMAAGICGSDIPRAYSEGAHNMPLIIGHEFSGCIEDVGEGVSKQWMGKRVGIFPLIPCRNCGPCRAEHYEMCRNYSYLGSRCNGGFAEYVTVPETNLIELPAGVSYEAAAMLEPMAVAVHAMRRLNLQQKNLPRVAVIGLGTIGTLLVMFLKEAGFEDLFVIGNKDSQKRNMMELGISEDRYCDSSKCDACDFILSNTDGKGADVFFECVGTNDAANIAVDAAAPSGQVCFVGNPHSDMVFAKKVYWKILRNQLRIAGTWNSSFTGKDDDDWHYVLKRLASVSIVPEKLITQKYPLEDIVSGFELMRDKKEEYIKVMAVTDKEG